MKPFPLFLLAACVFAVSTLSAEPSRRGGVSSHMLPKEVAALDPDGKMKWGFDITYAPYLKPEAEKPVFQTAESLLTFVKKQDPEVRDNGLWLVVTNPASYSKEELALVEEVKAVFHREHIPLFICRGAELPDGWKRFDQ